MEYDYLTEGQYFNRLPEEIKECVGVSSMNEYLPYLLRIYIHKKAELIAYCHLFGYVPSIPLTYFGGYFNAKEFLETSTWGKSQYEI